MTEKSEIDLLYEAADIAGFDAAKGWPAELELLQFLSLMLGHRWLPPLREPQPITMEYPDGRIEQCGYTPDLRIFDTPETEQRRKASIIIAKMLNDAGLKIENRGGEKFVVTCDAATVCLDAIGKLPPQHIRPWLESVSKVGAGDTAPVKTHALPGIPTKEIIDGFRLAPAKRWADKLKRVDDDAKEYKELFADGLSALVQRGGPGKGSHTWNPARFGVRLMEIEKRNYLAVHTCISNNWRKWLDEFDGLAAKGGILRSPLK